MNLRAAAASRYQRNLGRYHCADFSCAVDSTVIGFCTSPEGLTEYVATPSVVTELVVADSDGVDSFRATLPWLGFSAPGDFCAVPFCVESQAGIGDDSLL
jgi:hypothetical protein